MYHDLINSSKCLDDFTRCEYLKYIQSIDDDSTAHVCLKHNALLAKNHKDEIEKCKQCHAEIMAVIENGQKYLKAY